MSGQQQGAYDTGIPSGTMGGLVHSVETYLSEVSSGQTHHVVPQPRGQSLHHQGTASEYSHQSQNTTQYSYYDYYGEGRTLQQQESAYNSAMDANHRYSPIPSTAASAATTPSHYRNGSYSSNDLNTMPSYGGGAYTYENSSAYNQNYSPAPGYHPPPPLSSRSSYSMPTYPPQRLADGSNGSSVGHSSPPVAAAQLVYSGQQPLQDYQVHRTPPGSPARQSYYQSSYQQHQTSYPQQQQQQNQMPPPPVGFTSIPSSTSTCHSRPGSQDLGHSNSHQRRNNSSMRMITTIERPRYEIPATIDTSRVGEMDEGVPFVPVSPISSDDDDDDYPVYNRTPTSPPPPPPPVTLPPPPPPPPPTAHYTMVSHVRQAQQELGGFGEDQVQDELQEPAAADPVPSHTQRMSSMSLEVNADYSILSELSVAFKLRMKRITNVREVKSSNEYPESFSGQEAIALLQEILAEKGIPEGFCVLVANALMNSTPPLFEPIRQNYKSLITNEVYNSSDQFYTFDEDLSDNDLPVGVFTPLTNCYVDGCLPGSGGCYAPKCPNRADVFEKDIMSHSELGRRSSVQSIISFDDTKTIPPAAAWAQRVPKELLEATSKRERERQEAINEMIYSEEIYLKDLNTLHEVIVQPLWNSGVIPEKRVGAFIKRVFTNYETLRELSDTLSKKLFDIQRKYDGKCIPGIGDILVDEFKYYADPYTTYTPNVPLAEYLLNQEKATNPEFARFIGECEKNERMRRLPFRHFLVNPVTRMQRYPLLLQAIIKKTDEEHIDHKYLVNCKEVIQNIATRSDMQTAYTKQQIQILEINDVLNFKPGESYDLQLTDPHRRLYYRGDLKRRGQGIEVTEKSDIHAFLFDHIFIMTKVRKGNNGDDYRLWKRPIQLQLLFVLGGTDYQAGTGNLPNGGVSLTLQHLGQRDGLYHFFCNSMEERQGWIRAIEEAKTALRKRQGDNDVFEMRVIDDASFRYFGSSGGQARVTCTMPFVSRTGEQKIVIGTESGVFIKTEGQPTVRRVLQSDNVTQVAVMERHHILLVLADKVLRAYSIDALDTPSNSRTPERMHEVAQNVSFFQVGVCNYKSLCIYKRKKGTSSSFMALEPVCSMRDSKSERLFTQRSGFFSSRGSGSAWFSTYKEFYVGAEASNVHFLKSKVSVVVESRGFEVIDPENLIVGGRNIPDRTDPQFNFIQRYPDQLKPLVMYRVADKFLLCYNRFAFYVNNRNGSLVVRGSEKQEPWLCKWHGTPDHIVYYHPYILAVDQQFIEIWSVETGDLVQIIKGDNLRLTYYSGGGEAPIIHCCMSHPQRPDMQLLFQLCLSNTPNHRSNNSRRSGF